MEAKTYLAFVKFKRQKAFGLWFDTWFWWIMLWVSGAPDEVPQRTHPWNNKKYSKEELSGLDPRLMVSCDGDPREKRLGGLRRHLTRWGGWKGGVVLSPERGAPIGECFIGWINPDGSGGISQVPIRSDVRLLLGPDEGRWFAVKEVYLSSGGTTLVQIPLNYIGRFQIGEGGLCCTLPLL